MKINEIINPDLKKAVQDLDVAKSELKKNPFGGKAKKPKVEKKK